MLLFLGYIYTHLSDFKQLVLAKPYQLIILAMLSLLHLLINGLIIKYLVEPFHINLPFREWFGLAVITNFYNALTPFRGGLIAKAAYLRQRYSFPIAHFIAMMAGIYVIHFLTAGISGLLCMCLIYYQYKICSMLVSAIFIGAIFSMLVIIFFLPELPETSHGYLNKCIQVINGWHTIKGNKKILTVVSLVATLQLLLGSIMFLISFSAFGIVTAFTKVAALNSMATFSILIGITPGNLGISEAISVFTGLVMGIPPAQSIAAVLLRRAVGTSVILLLGPIFSYILLTKTHDARPEKR